MSCLAKFQFVLISTTLALATLSSAVNSDKIQDAKCLLPVDPGPCRMSLSRFYYNAQSDTCEEFKFGGCKGNDNKFGFKETCEAACKKSTGADAIPTSAVTSATTETTQLKTATVKGVIANTVATTSKGGTATTSTTATPKVK